MQHLANKVGSVIVKHNRDDMKEISENIAEENEMCGFENPNLVNVEYGVKLVLNHNHFSQLHVLLL
jgi:hypothetical protein